MLIDLKYVLIKYIKDILDDLNTSIRNIDDKKKKDEKVVGEKDFDLYQDDLMVGELEEMEKTLMKNVIMTDANILLVDTSASHKNQ